MNSFRPAYFPALFIALFISLFFTGCSDSVVYQEYKEVPSLDWKYDYKLPFNFTINDTNAVYNTYFNIRLKSSYAFSNIWITCKKFNTVGDVISEKMMEFELADIDGRWYGQGLGDIIDYQLLMEDHIKFSEKGDYTYYLNHEMRSDSLSGVMDIGLTVLKVMDE